MTEENISFEAALARLEEITRMLENGSATLDESLKLFEEGVQLVRLCNDRLEGAKLRILKVTTPESDTSAL